MRRIPRPLRHLRSNSAAVSSVIGTILMVGITTVIFGGVAVVVLSEVSEQQLNENSQLDARRDGSSSFVMRHNGGDPLPLSEGRLLIAIDGVRVPDESMTIFASQVDNGADWFIGEYLCVVGSEGQCLYPPGTNVTSAQVAVRNTLVLAYGESIQNAISADGVDLRLSVVAPTPNNPSPSQTVTFATTYTNAGNEEVPSSESFTIHLRVNGASVDTVTINGPLGAGASSSTNLQWTPSAEGTYTYTITIDDGNAVSETNEANNVHTSTMTVTDPSNRPDLTPGTVSVSDTTPTAGSTVTFTFNVMNGGPGNVESTQSMQVALFMDGASTAAATRTISGPIANGANVATSLTWTASGAGSHSYVVRVDSSNTITEVDETNNDSPSGTVTVQGGSDPGHPFIDNDGDGQYDPAVDGQLTVADIEDGYDAGTGTLIVPATANGGNDLVVDSGPKVWEGDAGVVFNIGVIHSTGGDLVFQSTNGDVRFEEAIYMDTGNGDLVVNAGRDAFIAPGSHLFSGAKNADFWLNADRDVIAVSTTLDAGSGSVLIGQSSFIGDDVLLQGATLIGDDRVRIRANGDIDVQSAKMQSDRTIDLWMNDSTDTIYIQDVLFRNFLDNGPRNADGDPNASWTGTPGAGSGTIS